MARRSLATPPFWIRAFSEPTMEQKIENGKLAHEPTVTGMRSIGV